MQPNNSILFSKTENENFQYKFLHTKWLDNN